MRRLRWLGGPLRPAPVCHVDTRGLAVPCTPLSMSQGTASATLTGTQCHLTAGLSAYLTANGGKTLLVCHLPSVYSRGGFFELDCWVFYI